MRTLNALVSVTNAAQIANVSRQTVFNWTAIGLETPDGTVKLRRVEVCGKSFVDTNELRRFLKHRRKVSAA